MTSRQALVWVCLSVGAGRGRLKGRKRKSTGYSALSQAPRARRNLLRISYLPGSRWVLTYDGKRKGDKSLGASALCQTPRCWETGDVVSVRLLRKLKLGGVPLPRATLGRTRASAQVSCIPKPIFHLCVYPHSRQWGEQQWTLISAVPILFT